MKQFKSTEEILDFAIGEEQSASDFYTALAQQVSSPSVRRMFMEFSEEELQHKSKLENIRMGSVEYLPRDQVVNLGLEEVLVDVAPTSNMDYQDALILAMKKEKAAYQMYMRLATVASDPRISDLLRGLASQEANHRLRFEIEYDEHVLTED
ncbi:MAG: ferritin family protein [Candidatus Fermentibacteraceae bacterium]|nr:ferritin family protein [Candidatus Fermentibacteraceae bacterium]MBN2608856.1 ferritin family protein [Candidatus Fermentibacteraceae bacterium]